MYKRIYYNAGNVTITYTMPEDGILYSFVCWAFQNLMQFNFYVNGNHLIHHNINTCSQILDGIRVNKGDVMQLVFTTSAQKANYIDFYFWYAPIR